MIERMVCVVTLGRITSHPAALSVHRFFGNDDGLMGFASGWRRLHFEEQEC
jgi:hypothetical protein